MTRVRDYLIPGLAVRDLEVDVPLDWARPDGPTISVFARELTAPQRRHEDLPVLLYLQGGPGGKSPRPEASDGWLKAALASYRVVLLDQRGTGRSTKLDGRRMQAFASTDDAAEHLARHRADSIVADAEHLRKTEYGGRRFVTLGQSYGGFLTCTYLSRAPEGLAACLVTGGLPSLEPDAVEVYRRTYPHVEAKNRRWQQRFPHLVEVVAAVADRLAGDDVRLPDGDRLTVRRLQSLGLDLGMQHGAERLAWLFDEAMGADGNLDDAFLDHVRTRTGFVDNPLFAALQESIYGSGTGEPTASAAQRVRGEHPEFDEDARPLLFTGEMIYPWMFDEIRALRPFAPAVARLAGRSDWGEPLYDTVRLAANDVPVCAAVYAEDMFVDADLQRRTADAIGNCQVYLTNAYEHDGLGVSDDVFTTLVRMLDERGGPDFGSTLSSM